MRGVLIVSHYHYDHHNPEETALYENKSQSKRESYFFGGLKGIPEYIKIADGSEFLHDKTLIRFSAAVCHGTNPRLGYVVQTAIECGGEKFIHTNDVDGPSMPDQIYGS